MSIFIIFHSTFANGVRGLGVIFIESPSFAHRVFELLTEDELIALEDRLLESPNAGVLIPGSRGLRKQISPTLKSSESRPKSIMKTSELKQALQEVHAIERGQAAPARVREVIRGPDGTLKRTALDPESYRRKQARAWKAKTEAARIRHELNLTQADFAELLGVSLATVRKWERGSGQPSSAARTLLAVARTHPNIVREATCSG